MPTSLLKERPKMAMQSSFLVDVIMSLLEYERQILARLSSDGTGRWVMARVGIMSRWGMVGEGWV
jgi:hypothetical protein